MSQTAAGGGAGTVLVLAGGGGRGAAELGVMRALADFGIQPDALVGTSVGALNAAAAAGLPMAEAVAVLERIWESPETRDIFRRDIRELLSRRVSRAAALRSGRTVAALVDRSMELTGLTTFEAMARPLRVVVTEVATGRAVSLGSGGLRPALCASCAVPLLFPPVTIGGISYMDGGVAENCGMVQAERLGADRIVAIDVSASAPGSARTWMEQLDRVMRITLHSRSLADQERVGARIPVTLLCPVVAESWPRFEQFPAMVETARRRTAALLPRIATADGTLAAGVHRI